MFEPLVTSSGSSRLSRSRSRRVLIASDVSRPPLREELERFPVPVGALADHAGGGDLREDGVLSPLLALLDVREVHLDDRRVEELERVADRIAVVRPRAGIRDDAAGPVKGVVAPPDVFALAVRLAAVGVELELARPGVDLALELVQAEPAVELGVATVQDVEI